MKRLLVIAYLMLSISVMLTAASWFTWGNSCEDIYRLAREGDHYSGMCVGDGVQFVGIFGFFLVITLIYLAVTALIFKIVGLKLTKNN
jgi:hypothetical protein